MPQVDLCGDNKVVCETLVDDDDIDNDDNTAVQAEQEVPVAPPDYAPESFWLSKDAELDWLDRNAFMERKDSGKGSHSTNLVPNPVQTGSSNRYSGNLKSKASIIGLPKPTKQSYAEAKSRRHSKPASIRLFPKRSESVGGSKPGTALSEPSSPKVSCMGRVRSKKDRSKRGKNRKKQGEPGLVRNKSIKERKTGFWKNFRSIFRPKPGKGGCKEGEGEWGSVVIEAKRSSSIKKKRGFDFNSANGGSACGGSVSCGLSETGSVEPPGLGGVKRFVSGRRSDAWAADLEVGGAKSEPLDRGPIWRRREKGPPVDVKVDRDWQSVGPASV